MFQWITTKAFGQLNIEEILVTFDIPLLFVCKDDHDERYLGLCINEEAEEESYLIGKISISSLINMLSNKITMYDIFLADGQKMIVKMSNKQLTEQEIKTNELSDDMLPDKGTYYEIWNSKIENYVQKLKKEEETE